MNLASTSITADLAGTAVDAVCLRPFEPGDLPAAHAMSSALTSLARAALVDAGEQTPRARVRRHIEEALAGARRGGVKESGYGREGSRYGLSAALPVGVPECHMTLRLHPCHRQNLRGRDSYNFSMARTHFCTTPPSVNAAKSAFAPDGRPASCLSLTCVSPH